MTETNRNPVDASFDTAEVADVSGGNHTVTINGGIAKAIYVGNAGDVELITPNGETVVYSNVQAGVWPFSCTSVLAANTTVPNLDTDIVVGAW